MPFAYRFVLLLLVFYCSSEIKAQEKNKRFEVVLYNDNDVYLFQGQDRYYTNGLRLDFSVGFPQDSAQHRKPSVLNVAIGHQMYNGVRMWMDVDDYYWDRPFVAYLYLNAEWTQFLTEDKLLSYQVELGQIGPKAQGEAIQNFIHDTFKMYDVLGWDDELPNSLGVDLSLKYQQTLVKSTNQKFDISMAGNAKLGTHFVNGGISIPLRFGKINPLSKSVFTKGHLTSTDKKNEFFVYYEPSLSYQTKNRTIAEGYATNGQKMTSGELRPLIFSHKLGLMYSKNTSTIGFSIAQYHTEAKEMLHKMHQYGQLFYGFRF